jgi:hypothetical protein
MKSMKKMICKRLGNLEREVGYLTEPPMLSNLNVLFGSEFTERVQVTALADLIPFATLNGQTPYPQEQLLLRKLERHTLRNLVPFMEYLPSYLNKSFKDVIIFASNGRVVPDIVSVLGKALKNDILSTHQGWKSAEGASTWQIQNLSELRKSRAVFTALRSVGPALGPGLMIFLWSSTKSSGSH